MVKGFRFEGSELLFPGLELQGLGFRILGFKSWVRVRVQDFGFRFRSIIQGSGVRFRFRV